MFLENKKYKLIYSIDNRVAKIGYLGIKKSFQKEGLGREIVKKLLLEFKTLNVERIEIDAYKKSIGFWEKCGFIVDKKPQIVDGHIQDYHPGLIKI